MLSIDRPKTELGFGSLAGGTNQQGASEKGRE